MRRGRNLHGELSWGWLALGPGRTPPWPQRCGRLVGVTGGLRPRQQPMGHETSKRVEGRLRQRRENAHLPRGDSCTVPGQEHTVSPSLAERWDPPSLGSPGTPRGPLPATARDQICEGEGLGLPSRRRHSSPPGARRVPSLQKSATSAGLAEASSHGGDPPHFAPLVLRVGISQPPLLTRSVRGKVWACLPEDGTPVPPAPAEYRACGNRSSRAGICPGWRTPPHFAALVLLVGLEQGLLVTRSVRGKVWAILPEDGTPVASTAAKFRALGNHVFRP